MGNEKYWSGTLKMEPSHDAAYLLAILICIFLMLLVGFALLMCYLRRNGYNISNRASMKFGAATRDQSTSMTSFIWNLMDQKLPVYNCQAIPFTVDIHKITSSMSLDSNMLYISGENEGVLASSMDNKSVKKSDSSGQYSALKCMVSSGASLLGSVMEKSSMFSLKSKRRSSSLKSGIDVDVMMVPLESPVHVSSSKAFQAVSFPTHLSRSSTLFCEDSCDQQFTWNTVGFSTHCEHITQTDAGFVPNALEKEPHNTEEEEKSVKKDKFQAPYPDLLEPKCWFVPIGNRPVSDGAKLEKKELKNVTSVDSGVDTTELLQRPGSGSLDTMPKILPTQGSANYVPLSSTNVNTGENIEEEETQENCDNLHITHQEAARELNSGNPGRSLWEKREERPLIGVN